MSLAQLQPRVRPNPIPLADRPGTRAPLGLAPVAAATASLRDIRPVRTFDPVGLQQPKHLTAVGPSSLTRRHGRQSPPIQILQHGASHSSRSLISRTVTQDAQKSSRGVSSLTGTQGDILIRRPAPLRRAHEDRDLSGRSAGAAGFGSPGGGLIGLPISFVLKKSKLHLEAHEMAIFGLIAGAPSYVPPLRICPRHLKSVHAGPRLHGAALAPCPRPYTCSSP